MTALVVPPALVVPLVEAPTHTLARQMVALDAAAQAAEQMGRYGLAERLRKQREEVRFERSVLLRQLWLERRARL